MAAKDLGNKHTCFKCSAKFYDLKKPDPVCPKCGSNQKESPANRPAGESRRGRLAAAKPVLPLEPVAEEAETEQDEDDFEDDEDAEIPDEDEEA